MVDESAGGSRWRRVSLERAKGCAALRDPQLAASSSWIALAQGPGRPGSHIRTHLGGAWAVRAAGIEHGRATLQALAREGA